MLMTHPHFSIAIVDSNMLAAIGMQQILADIMPIAEVRVFASFEQLETLKDTPFVHYFVSSRIFFEHAAFFREPSRRVIVLAIISIMPVGVRNCYHRGTLFMSHAATNPLFRFNASFSSLSEA